MIKLPYTDKHTKRLNILKRRMTMAYGRALRVGDKIEIEPARGAGDDMETFGERTFQYLSKVEEIIDDVTFIISKPIWGRQFINLQVGDIIKVAYFREEALYYFKAKVLEELRSRETMSAKVVAMSDRYKIQRRNYYRLSIIIPVIMTYLEEKEQVTKNCSTVDISGGGVRLLTDQKLQRGTEAWLYINIPGIERHAIKASVIRSIPSARDIKLYETALEYKHIDQPVRDIIIKYIFDKQRQIIKKGMR